MAVAAASFKIEKLAISSGLIPCKLTELSGTPSITIRGSLLALKDAPPLIRIVLPEPGWPPLEVIETPATLPAINCSGEVIDPC